MSDRYFLDTDVLVYSFDTSSKTKAQKATQLIRNGLKTGKAVISYQVAQEFFNVALRKFAHPMSSADAEAYLSTVLLPMMTVQSSHDLLTEAIYLQSRYKTSWYDAIIIAAAIQAQCEVIYSEDLNDGQRFGSVRVENPF